MNSDEIINSIIKPFVVERPYEVPGEFYMSSRSNTNQRIMMNKKEALMYKQIIIVRKDLQMSHGKMAAQVAHASMSFLSWFIRDNTDQDGHIDAWFDKDILDNWLNGIYTKVVLQAKNKGQLEKAIALADEIGLAEGKDYFLIKDNCLTELEPEEVDENGVGRTLTCIGFRPMDSEVIDKVAKKFHIYVG